ncbi:hypothetical protein [Kibdelosporangium philippinense]|uniref:hypothetical protein n=1 Tax=Kibdelosporangium philippinense TaxID=211113 RepID=UPI00360C2BF8
MVGVGGAVAVGLLTSLGYCESGSFGRDQGWTRSWSFSSVLISVVGFLVVLAGGVAAVVFALSPMVQPTARSPRASVLPYWCLF